MLNNFKLNQFIHYYVFCLYSQKRVKKKRKKQQRESKAPHTWYNYLENKKAEEAHERKQFKNIFLHVVEGGYMRGSRGGRRSRPPPPEKSQSYSVS